MGATVSEFAAAKINLALHVLGRRPDGYHELDSLVAFADVGDELQFTPAAEFSIVASGPFASDLPAPEDNLIFTAWKAVGVLARARRLHLPPVHVALTKNLPVAAGIGGGSANAAAAIRGFTRLAGIESIDAEIWKAALTLGADVPACLISKACRLQGIGERITPLENFPPLHAVLINPKIAVQTADVFRKLGLAKGESYGAPISPSPLWGRAIASAANAAGWVGVGVAPASPTFTTWRNDLTPPASAIAPVIAEAIAALETQQGLHIARMSGSGATCFGIFENAETALAATRTLIASQPHYWTRQVMLN